MSAQEGDWWAGKSSAEQFVHLLESGALSDCTFRVSHPDSPQDTKEFQLHRLVLSKASVVWERMLLPPAGEPHMSEADTGIVHITDIQPHIFHHVLRHVYGDEGTLTTLSYPEVQKVLQVADRYQVPSLVWACEAWLCQELITPDTVWSALHLVDALHGLDKLKRACVKVLRYQTEACLKNPGFLTSPESALELLLSQEALYLTSEFFLVRAVVRWAKERVRQGLAQSTRSALLPRLLPLLRLAACSKEHLEIFISLSDWLTEEEEWALESGDVTSFPPTLNRENPRQTLTLDPLSPLLLTLNLSVVRTLSPREISFEEMCAFIFKVSGEIVLHGFTVPSQTKESPEANISLVGSTDQYMEDLEIAVYKLNNFNPEFDYDAQHLAQLSTKYKALTPYNSKIYIPLPTPLQLKSNQMLIKVIFKNRGFYPIHQLTRHVRCDTLDFEFRPFYVSAKKYDGSFIESISYMQVER